MLFHIQADVVDEALRAPHDYQRIVRIENLLRAHREGKHVVLLDPATGQRLLNAGALSAVEGGTLRNILARRAEIGGLKSRLSYYTEIYHGDGADSAIERRGSQTVIRATSAWLDDSLMTQAAVLLTENQTDASVLERLCHAYLASVGIQGIRLAMEARGGGGSTIADEQEALKGAPRVSMCVVDGDLYYPSGSFGQTAEQLLETCDNCPTFQTQFVIGARELENIIPTEIFEDVFTRRGATALAPAIDRLRILEENIPGNWRLFIDLKEGLCHCDIVQYRQAKGEAAWKFIEGFFTAVQSNSKTKIRPCASPGHCSKKSSCRAIVVGGFGPNALSEVAKHIQELSSHQLSNRLRFVENSILTMLCERIFSWFCSYARLRA